MNEEPMQFKYGPDISEQTAEAEATKNIMDRQQAAQDYLIESPGDLLKQFTRPDFENPEVKDRKYNRDYTVTNLNLHQYEICKIYRMLIQFCNDHKLDEAKSWFIARIQDILVLTRSLEGFERLCMITGRVDIQKPPVAAPKRKWLGFGGRR